MRGGRPAAELALLPRPVASLPGALACEARAGDRITGRSFAMRSQVIAQHGIGATSHPLATQAGLDVLKAVGTGPTRRSAAWSRCRIDIGGRGVFHKGCIAHLSGDCFRANDGVLSYADRAAHHGEWVEPIPPNDRGCDVRKPPPNGQGSRRARNVRHPRRRRACEDRVTDRAP